MSDDYVLVIDDYMFWVNDDYFLCAVSDDYVLVIDDYMFWVNDDYFLCAVSDDYVLVLDFYKGEIEVYNTCSKFVQKVWKS